MYVKCPKVFTICSLSQRKYCGFSSKDVPLNYQVIGYELIYTPLDGCPVIHIQCKNSHMYSYIGLIISTELTMNFIYVLQGHQSESVNSQ